MCGRLKAEKLPRRRQRAKRDATKRSRAADHKPLFNYQHDKVKAERCSTGLNGVYDEQLVTVTHANDSLNQ